MGEDESISMIRHLRRLEKARIKQFFDAAEGYMMLNMFEDALSEIDKILAREPENSKALYLEGLLHVQLGNYQAAEKQFQNLLAVKPENIDVYIHLAYIYRRTKGLDDAIEMLEDGLKINTLGKGVLSRKERRLGVPLANYNLACYYSLKNKIDEALHHLTIAIELDKQYMEAANTDEDFDSIKNDPRFRSLTSNPSKRKS